MDPVVHFEMAAKDRDRMAEFYKNVFGWKMNKLDDKMGNYTLVSTAETDEKGMLKKPGRINGGFYPVEKDDPEPHHPSIVIAVDDLKASMKKIKDAGGKLLDEPVEIPGYGTYISFLDTEGNRVSMIEPVKEMKE